MFKSVSVVVASCALAGCGAPERAVDPDGREHEAKVQSAPLPDVAMAEVIGAVAGVPDRDAAATLEHWLKHTRGGEPVLAAFPRANGQLDLEHGAQLASIEASIGPGSKSKCGEVIAVFHTRSGALRMKLSIPSTTPQCRGLFRASHVTGAEAAPFLRAAIAYGRVPAMPDPKVVAAN
jgi:hypothetical protein